MIKNILQIFLLIIAYNANSQNDNNMNYNELSDFERYIIIEKGTEQPFTGVYNKHYENGIYQCKQCNAPLFRSDYKFDSGCGWPAFDNEIPEAVKEVPDRDGRRTEIVCANCGGHLGHVFYGEGFTKNNKRHCVNSASMNFVAEKKNDSENNIETAIFAAGCFWGVEHHLKLAKGVISTEVGYIGGKTKNPTYQEVCSGTTGHAEAVKVVFDNSKTDFETLAKLFFEIHDPGTLNRQGPDVGDQYRSEIFYFNKEQKQISEKLINILKEKGYKVVTRITPVTDFYKAEDYHQDYYNKSGNLPYCHFYKKKF